MRYTMKFWYDDMGSLTQPGVSSVEDGLWYVNNAREHDGLSPLKLEDLSDDNVKLIPEY